MDNRRNWKSIFYDNISKICIEISDTENSSDWQMESKFQRNLQHHCKCSIFKRQQRQDVPCCSQPLWSLTNDHHKSNEANLSNLIIVTSYLEKIIKWKLVYYVIDLIYSSSFTRKSCNYAIQLIFINGLLFTINRSDNEVPSLNT